MRFQILVDGLAEFAREVDDLRERMRNMKPLALRVAKRLRACFAENFNAEGRPDKWAPLAASTLAAKQALYESGLIRGRRRGVRVRLGRNGEQRGAVPGVLIRSGALKDSVARSHSKGNIERIRDDGKTLEVGTSVPYADVHDQGGQGPYTIMPRSGKVLSFFGIDRKTGQPTFIFTRGPVRHPAMKRRSFLVITEDTWDLITNDAAEYVGLGASSGGSADN